MAALTGLFDVIPGRFFSVLASPDREIYAHALFLLHDLFQGNLFGIPREAAVEVVEVYLDSVGGALAWTEATGEAEGAAGGAGLTEDGDASADTDAEGIDARSRANAVLRRLLETGWIEIETRSNYEEFVNLADYSIQVLDVLDRVRSRRRAEYAGFVYATYAALSIEDVERQGALALGQAFDRTEELIKELKSLHHNIRRYTERLLQQTQPQDILEMHFTAYKDEVLDRSYHQLKTSDHVARYRPGILERVERWLAEPEWIRNVARDEASRQSMTPEEAEVEVRRRLHFIRQAYRTMDDLLDEIDRRNAQYAKASFEQVRYHLSSGRDVEGQLTDLLMHVAERMRSGGRGTGAVPLPDGWDNLFTLCPVQTLEETSLWFPRQRREHHPAPLAARAVRTDERVAARQRAARRLAARMTPQRVEAYVQEALGDRPVVRAADLGIETVEDFVRLIYVAAYGGSRRVSYEVDHEGEPVAAAGGRYRFKNVTIRRKSSGGLGGRIPASQRP